MHSKPRDNLKISFLSIVSIILFCLVTLTVRKQMVTVQRKDDPQEEFGLSILVLLREDSLEAVLTLQSTKLTETRAKENCVPWF